MQDEKLALERVLVFATRAATDEKLANRRFTSLYANAKSRIIHRHISPPENGLTLFHDEIRDYSLASSAAFGAAWKEQHRHAVVANGGQGEAEITSRNPQELVGDLNQYPGAITHQSIRARSAAMGQIRQNAQALLHNRMGFCPVDIGDESDATGVMLVARIVQALGFG